MANPEVIVLGAGIAGAATAVFLARRGHRVVLFESHEPAHSGGSSHGDGRIIRYTYPEEVYVEMARRAYTAWADLETAAGESLVETTGSWECGPAGSLPLADLEASFERDGIAYDRLTPAESAERFPHFHLPEGSFALYQEHGGIVRAERAVRAFCRLAEQAGAQIVYQPIVAIEPSTEGVEVVAIEQTDESTFLPDFAPDPSKRYAFVFGNEVYGVTDEVVDASDRVVEIPQYGTKHSLNVSVSIGVILWDFIAKTGPFGG